MTRTAWNATSPSCGRRTRRPQRRSITTISIDIGFDASDSGDPDGHIVSWSWNFGDGNAATGETASHHYAHPGDYSVVLTVTDNDGDTATATQQVTATPVPNRAPEVRFDFTADNLAVAFDGTASRDTDGSIAAVEWDFGSGSAHATEEAGVTQHHSYAHTGDYRLADRDRRRWSGHHGEPQECDRRGAAERRTDRRFHRCAGLLAVSVDGSASTDTDGQVVAWSWDFGDGSAHASGKTATHSCAARATTT